MTGGGHWHNRGTHGRRQPLPAKANEPCQPAVGAVIIKGALNFPGIPGERHNGESTKTFISQAGGKKISTFTEVCLYKRKHSSCL